VVLGFVQCPGAAAQPVIDNFTLRQFEGGPAVARDYRALPGEQVFADFQVSQFGKSDDPDPKVRLEYALLLTDSSGLLVAESRSGKVEVELADEDKKWRPRIGAGFALPALLNAGTYQLRIVVKDLIAQTEVRQQFPVPVGGRVITPPAALSALNLRWFRSEESTVELDAPDYAPGEPIWARFDLSGFNLGPRNTVQIEYGLVVRDAAGKVLFRQELCAREDRQFFYPPPAIPGVISLAPNAKVARGRYTATLILRDLIAKTTSESVHSFHIR
jgi:hypothetical protein